MKTHDRKTFRQIVQATRQQAATSAWERALVASSLRHLAASRGDRQSARRLSWMKEEAIRLVALLVPDQLKITLDSDHHVGLVSVRLEGHGRLHLPANSSIRQDPAPSSVPRCCLAMGMAEPTATCSRPRKGARCKSRLR